MNAPQRCPESGPRLARVAGAWTLAFGPGPGEGQALPRPVALAELPATPGPEPTGFELILTTSDDHERAAPWLGSAARVVLEVPMFKDGRGFSLARLLRERHGYPGPLRLRGNFSLDQLGYYARCGVDEVELGPQHDPATALRLVEGFSLAYQSAVRGRAAYLAARRHRAAPPR